MKFKTTKKDIMRSCSLVVSCGYCSVQNLFHGVSPDAYTCGVYGWNADIYIRGGTAIVTGYRPFGGNVYYDIIEDFDNRAKSILHNVDDIRKLNNNQELENLRNDFFKALWERVRNS